MAATMAVVDATSHLNMDLVDDHNDTRDTISPTALPTDDWFRPIQKDGETAIEVECGPNKALLFVQRLSQGSKGACVFFQDAWLTPNEFQFVSGRETAKDWKRSIKHNGKSIKLLFSKGVLTSDETPPKKRKKAKKTTDSSSEAGSTCSSATAPEYQSAMKAPNAPVFPGMDLDEAPPKVDVSEKENRDVNVPNSAPQPPMECLNSLLADLKDRVGAGDDGSPSANHQSSVIDSIIGSVVTSSLRPNQSPGRQNDVTAKLTAGDTPIWAKEPAKLGQTGDKQHTIEYKPEKTLDSATKRKRSSKKLSISTEADEARAKKPKPEVVTNAKLASGMQSLMYMPWAAAGMYGGPMFNPYLAATNPKLYEKYLQTMSMAATVAADKPEMARPAASPPGGAVSDDHSVLDLTVKKQPEARSPDPVRHPLPAQDTPKSSRADTPKSAPNSPGYFARLGHFTAAAQSPGRDSASGGVTSSPLKASGECGRVGREAQQRIEAWSVEKVGQYLRSSSDTAPFAQVFVDHQISGKSLTFLTTDDMTRAMGLKLGPALTLKAAIRNLIGQCAYCEHCLHCHAQNAN